MSTKRRILISGSNLVLLIVILFSPVFGSQGGETVKRGRYSLKRAPIPKNFVTGVSLPVLSKVRYSNMYKVDTGLAGKWGRYRTLFNKEDKRQVKITVAVYGKISEAEDSALELLTDISAVMKQGSKSGSVIGTHSWYLESRSGSGTIVFIYKNSLFQVFSSDYNLAESSSRAIVGDLTIGINGIRLGKRVVLPEVTDVKLPSGIKEGRTVSLILKGRDVNQQKISFSVSSSKGQLFDTKIAGEKRYTPTKEGVDELKIYAINEMNVVSRGYAKKIEIKKDN